jgi:hypothetical protein
MGKSVTQCISCSSLHSLWFSFERCWKVSFFVNDRQCIGCYRENITVGDEIFGGKCKER